MENNTNVHTGHRSRMLNKVMKAPDTLSEHEILEVILYPLLPRRDTNPLAHKILRAFGSLNEVFNASEYDLLSVQGVTKNMASHIMAIGQLLPIIYGAPENQVMWSNFETNRAEICKMFVHEKREKMYLILLTRGYNVLYKLDFEGTTEKAVIAKIPEITKAFSIHKPHYAVVAHNHPVGTNEPSTEDDLATRKVNLICRLYGVELADHVIVGRNGAFSYYHSEGWEKIKEQSDPEKIMNILVKNYEDSKNKEKNKNKK